MDQEIWVYSETMSLLKELITPATGLGPVAAVWMGSRSQADELIGYGVNRVFWMGEFKEGGLLDDVVPTLSQLAIEQKPALILIGSTRRGKAIAGRLAARLGTSAITDILNLQKENGGFQASHLLFGGGAVRTDLSISEIAIATVSAGVFPPASSKNKGTAEIIDLEFIEPTWRATLRERRPLPKSSVNLKAAKKVITAGRGIARKEDLALVEELAGLLDAEVACTRPLAEGLDWLPHERYIGISGANIKPDLYFGVGVSGQVQHMIGMYGSRVVVAVNKDRNAPIFSQADYGIPADLYQFLPELIKALKNRSG